MRQLIREACFPVSIGTASGMAFYALVNTDAVAGLLAAGVFVFGALISEGL